MEKLSKEDLKKLILSCSDGAKILEELLKTSETEYVVQISNDIKEGLKNGVYFLAKSLDDNSYTTMVREVVGDSSKLKTNLTIAETNVTANYADVANIMHRLETRQQFDRLNEKIDNIDRNINSLVDDNKAKILGELRNYKDALANALTINDLQDRKNDLRECSNNLKRIFDFLKELIEGKINNFKKIPNKEILIYKNLLTHKQYKTECDKAFNEIFGLFEYYESLMDFEIATAVVRDEVDYIRKRIYDEKYWLSSLNLENIKTISYLYPEDDLSKEWFYNISMYAEKTKNENLKTVIEMQDRKIKEMKGILLDRETVIEIQKEIENDQNKECAIKAKQQI